MMKYQKEQRDEARFRRASQPVAIRGEFHGKQFGIAAQIHGTQTRVVVIRDLPPQECSIPDFHFAICQPSMRAKKKKKKKKKKKRKKAKL
jgi:hypothetical protein